MSILSPILYILHYCMGKTIGFVKQRSDKVDLKKKDKSEGKMMRVRKIIFVK